MAIIYEHWRPDLNECFYVGASKIGQHRAFNFSEVRNKKWEVVVIELKAQAITPIVKIVWHDLPEDCVGAYEKIRILYWRALVGNRLSNLSNGGNGFNLDWSEELCFQHSERMKAWNSKRSFEERRLGAQKAWTKSKSRTKEQFREASRKANAKKTSEQRLLGVLAAVKASANRSPEQRSEDAKKRWKNKTVEQRRVCLQAAVEANKNISKEQRSQAAKLGHERRKNMENNRDM